MVVLYSLFLVASSVMEGLFWANYKGRNPKYSIKNIHIWLTLMRFGVWLMFPIWELILMVFTFPLFHDGIYYTTRHLLDRSKYPNHFFDVSTTSTAFMTFNFWIRALLAIIGLTLYVFLGIY